MPSRIDPTRFADGQPVSKADLRQALSDARAELEHGGFVRLAATDAVERPVQEKLSEWVSVKDFGAKGDGVTDDSAALVRLRDYMKFRSDTHFHVYFPPGTFIYENNRWLLGVHSITLEGRGTKLQCISKDVWEANKRPLNMHSMFYDFGFQAMSSPVPYNSGYKIASSESGEALVTLLEPEKVAEFGPGDRVFIHGFDQQFGGWPPNFRYFEWNEIVAIDVAEGRVTLRNPLKNSYDARWRELFDNGFVGGKPRMLKLERQGFHYPTHVEINGFEFLLNPNGQYSALQISADYVEVADIICRGNFYPTESRVFTVRKSSVDGLTEVDKLCDRVSFSSSRLNAVTAGTGANEVELVGCELNARTNLKPRRATIRGCNIRPKTTETRAIQIYQDLFPASFIRIADCTIASSRSLASVVDNGRGKALVVDDAGVDRSIRLADTTANRLVIQDVAVGTMLYAPTLVDSGRVTDIWMDGDAFVLAGTWRAVPVPGETWTYYTAAEISISGLTFTGAKSRIPAVHRPFQLQTSSSVGNGRYVIDSDFSFATSIDTIEANGFLHSLRARVVAPYAGADSAPVLRVVLRDGSWQQEVAVVSLKESGFVDLGPDRTYATSPATTAVKLPANRPVRHIDLKYKNGGLGLSGSAEQMPRLAVELDLMPLNA